MTVSLVKRPLVSLVKVGGAHRAPITGGSHRAMVATLSVPRHSSALFVESDHVVYVNDLGVVTRNVVIEVGGVYGGWRSTPIVAV